MLPYRQILRLLLLLLVLAGILPFFFPWHAPLLSLSALQARLPSLPEMPAMLPDAEGKREEGSQPVTVYRWQDEQGQWHFSNSRPQRGVAATPVLIDPDANLIQSAPQTGAQTAPGAQPGPAQGSGKPVSAKVEELLQLKQKAEAARAALERRYEEQEERLQQLR